MQNKIKTTVHIAGREYAISSYDSEEYVQGVAGWVDRRMRELHQATRLPGGQLAVLTAQPKLLGAAAALVVVSTVLPYLLYTAGLARIDSGKVAILASVEPVVAALVGVLVFHETMDVSTALGVASILAAVVLLRE